MILYSEQSKQESLTSERLSKISCGYKNSYKRPDNGDFISLIEWAKKLILTDRKITTLVDTFVHNKITVDGSFVKFCEEKKCDLVALHTDAITSWTTDYGDEHFVSVGIFQVSNSDFRFFPCGLFHKGNQNDDEVSFFVIVEREHSEKYIAFRNEFDDWQKKRERDDLNIEVIGGNPIPYNLDNSWDDLFLPEDLRVGIVTLVEGFLKSKDIFNKLKVPWRTGVGFWGERATGKTTCLRVLMSQYRELKPVTIQPGTNSPDELLEEAFIYAEEHAPSLLFFEDLQELIKTIELSHFLQLLDGIHKKDGILTIVTGNDFSDLQSNLKSRPRRFDRFFKFPLPDFEQSKKYIAKYFGDILSSKKVETIAKKAMKYNFTYAHLQELYFNSVFIAIPNGREVPNEEDIDQSLKDVIQEKATSDSDFSFSRKHDLTDD
jgi:hypothetical protein